MSDFRGASPSSEALSDGMDSLSMRDKALLKRSVSKHHNNNFKAGYVPVHEQYLNKTGLRGRKTLAFWTLVFLLFILALGNLMLTVTILGVLRMGRGMQSLEVISEEAAVKFYGETDFDGLYKRDGRLESYLDVPLAINSQGGSIKLNLSVNDRSSNKLSLERNGTSFKGFDNFKVKTTTDRVIFSTKSPRLDAVKHAKNLTTKMAETNRLVSPLNEGLKIHGRNIYVKGAEGTLIESRDVTWSADKDIFLKSLNGSLVLSAKEGTFIDVERMRIARSRHGSHEYSAYKVYKVCVCMPQGKLFKVEVPNKPNARVYCNHINMSEKNNPCM